jgi:hypothetical protein
MVLRELGSIGGSIRLRCSGRGRIKGGSIGRMEEHKVVGSLAVDIFPYTVHQVSRPFPASIHMVSVSPSCCVATTLELKVGESKCG